MPRFLPFEAIAAVRFMLEGLMQTLLIIVGVSVGVSVIVFMSALLTGLQSNFLNRVLSTQAHIVIISPPEVARPLMKDDDARLLRLVQKPAQRVRSIDQWQALRTALRTWPSVDIVAPVASGPALVVRGQASKSVGLTGIETDSYFHIVDVPGYIVAGSARLMSDDILLGTDLVDDLGAGLGDKLRVSTASGASRTLTIAGIFDLGNKGANQRSAFVELQTAQGLLGLTGGVSSVELALKDPYGAEEVAQAIESVAPVEADSWIKTNAQFFTAIRSQNISSIAIRISVALSVALGIASVLVVSVVQRSKEIGILRAMGASRAQTMRVFLVQGGIVGMLGSVVGVLIARGLLWVWLQFARNPDGTPFFVIEIETQLYVLTVVTATVVGVLAAVMPALRAARLDPVVAIRG